MTFSIIILNYYSIVSNPLHKKLLTISLKGKIHIRPLKFSYKY